MPSKDFIVKLAGDSKSYQSAMGQAAKSLDQFQKQNLSTAAAMKTVTTTLSKYISVAALAKGAVDAFNATIRGSQTTSDKFEASMRAAKTTVNTFFSSLSTGDFSQFNLGLDNLIRKSKEAAAALDRLGNASMSWNYFYNERMADITELQAIVNDKSLPMSQRKEAADKMADIQEQLKGYAQGYRQRANRALGAVLTEATSLDWTDITQKDVDNVIELDLLDVNLSEEKKAQLIARYKDYLAEVAKTKEDYIKNVQKFETQVIGVSPTGGLQYGQVDVTPEADRQLYIQDLKDIAREYMDAVLYQQMLERGSDEYLQSIIQISIQASQAERSLKKLYSSVSTAQASVGNDTETPTATGAKTKAPKTNYMSSLEIDRMMYQGRIQLAEQFSEEWVALKQSLRETEYQMEVERLTSTIQNEDDLAAALELAEQKKQKDLYDIAMEGYAKRLEANQKSTDSISKAMTNIRSSIDGIRDGGRAIESFGQAITSLSNSKGVSGIGNIVSSVGQAVQAYTQLAAAAQVAATAEAAAETPTVWGKISAVATVLTAFASMISQVHSMNSYAEGGIVPGRNWNDGITARVSSGEMVINEADQKRLYDSIHSGNLGGGGSAPAVITGEQIVLAVNNYGRRTNQGELVFAGR